MHALHAEIVQGHEDGHSVTEIAQEWDITEDTVEFALNVETQMRGWHG